MSNVVDLGSGVFARLFTCSHRETSSGAIIQFGGDLESECYDHDDVCAGSISWCAECRGPTWELVSLDPLHVEPSVRTTCAKHPEHHGHIRDGRWRPC